MNTLHSQASSYEEKVSQKRKEIVKLPLSTYIVEQSHRKLGQPVVKSPRVLVKVYFTFTHRTTYINVWSYNRSKWVLATRTGALGFTRKARKSIYAHKALISTLANWFKRKRYRRPWWINVVHRGRGFGQVHVTQILIRERRLFVAKVRRRMYRQPHNGCRLPKKRRL